MNTFKDIFKKWDILDTVILILVLFCIAYILLTYSEHFDPMF